MGEEIGKRGWWIKEGMRVDRDGKKGVERGKKDR